jgi:D-alanyl-D-alanine carboxypeptidase (penicillin-binding protein 5/6)
MTKKNKKAEELGMIHTAFTNSSGLHSQSHYSTAFDMSALARAAMKNPLIRDIVKTKSTVVTDVSGAKKHNLYNINRLVQEGYADGVKTGTTPQAGENVVASREENGHRLIVVVIDSKDRFGEAKKLLQYSFKNFTWAN